MVTVESPKLLRYHVLTQNSGLADLLLRMHQNQIQVRFNESNDEVGGIDGDHCAAFYKFKNPAVNFIHSNINDLWSYNVEYHSFYNRGNIEEHVELTFYFSLECDLIKFRDEFVMVYKLSN